MVNETVKNEQAEAVVSESKPAGRQRNLGRILRSPVFIGIVVLLLVVGAVAGYLYYRDVSTKVYVENSSISAPIISIGPEIPGVLKAIYVKEGDHVSVGQQLFNAGDRIVSARSAGIVTAVQNTPGQWASNQNAIVQMYDPNSLRVVGRLQEDQGLADVHPGQSVMFTVDAYPGKQYAGKVDTVATVADQSSIVFNISDKREEKQFDVKVLFDPKAYPELTNNMSAKMWVYKQESAQ